MRAAAARAATIAQIVRKPGREIVSGYISRDFQQYRRQTLKNIANETGKPLRMNRSIQVEGAFGAIKRDHSFRRFLTRGQEKVKIEFLLLNISCNVNKLHNKRERNRVQEYLHRNGLIA